MTDVRSDMTTQDTLTTADFARGQDDTAPAPTVQEDEQLLRTEDAESFRLRWSEVQSRFVDDPRGAVSEADTLVAELMRSLATRFAEHKDGLEQQWSSDREPDTEQLRTALQRYRSFFARLLTT